MAHETSAKIQWLVIIYRFKMGSYPVSALIRSYAPGWVVMGRLGSAVKLNMSMSATGHGSWENQPTFPEIGGFPTPFGSIWTIMEYQQETTT